MALRGGDAVSEPDNSGTTEKMTSFSMIRKKTPFQKHREEEEAKKRRADEEAARLYEEFVQSFKADDTPGGKAFVRGGTINPSERPKPDSESDPRVGSSKESTPASTKKPGSRSESSSTSIGCFGIQR